MLVLSVWTNRNTPAENLWFPSVMFLWNGTTSWESLVNTRRDTHCADNPQVNICNGSAELPASDSSMNHTCCPPPTAAPTHSSGNISPPFTTRLNKNRCRVGLRSSLESFTSAFCHSHKSLYHHEGWLAHCKLISLTMILQHCPPRLAEFTQMNVRMNECL